MNKKGNVKINSSLILCFSQMIKQTDNAVLKIVVAIKFTVLGFLLHTSSYWCPVYILLVHYVPKSIVFAWLTRSRADST